MAQRPKKLLDHVRDAIRLTHYSRHAEDAYVTWITRYIFFHDTRHPKVAASIQNQALSALLFLSRDVLRQPLDGPIDAVRARKPTYLPTVLTKEEALQVTGPSRGPMR